MDAIIFTSRLKLTLIERAPRGSQELDWLHAYRSNEKSTWWSLVPRSETIEATEKIIPDFMPLDPPEEHSKRVLYAVHETQKSSSHEGLPSKFIGVVNLRSMRLDDLALPSTFGLPAADDPETVTAELAYSLLPEAWGKGYATEALEGLFDACRSTTAFWSPYAKVYVRAIVNDENPASLRVMAKVPGMQEKGVFEVDRRIWLAGQWREHHVLHIFGMYLLD